METEGGEMLGGVVECGLGDERVGETFGRVKWLGRRPATTGWKAEGRSSCMVRCHLLNADR